MIINEKIATKINCDGFYTFGNDNKPYLDKHYKSYLLFPTEDKAKEYIKKYGMGEQAVYKVFINKGTNLFSLHKENDFKKYCRFARKYKTLEDFFKVTKYDGYFHESFSPNFSERKTYEIFDLSDTISVFDLKSITML